MDRSLLPMPNWTLRVIVCVVMALPALLSPGPLWTKLFGLAFVIVLTGSARESRVLGDEFETRLFVAFRSVKVERCKLKVVVEVETQLRQEANAADWLIFGGMMWAMDCIMRYIWPWMAGEFELTLLTARDKRVLAWRGNGEEAFQQNLATLVSATGARIRRG